MHSCICIYHSTQNPPRCNAELFEDSYPAWNEAAYHKEKKKSNSNEKQTNNKRKQQTNLCRQIQEETSKQGSCKFTVHVRLAVLAKPFH